MIRRCLLLFLSLMSVLVTSVLAAPIQEPFDSSAERLSPKFSGNDLRSVIVAVEELGKTTTKGEFESTAQYEERLARLDSQPISGHLHLSDTMAFVLPSAEVALSYDADKAAYHVRWDPDFLGIERQEKLAIISNSRKPTGSYVAANAFNRKVVVTKIADQTMGVLFEAHLSYPVIDVWVPLAPEVAREIKSSIRLVLIGKPKTPYLYRGTEHAPPTIDSPLDVQVSTTALRINAEALWLINQATGEVLKRMPLGRMGSYRD